jgi:hypothetical protein
MSFYHMPLVVCDHEGCEESYRLDTGEPHPGWVERPGPYAKVHYCPAHAAAHAPVKKKRKSKRRRRSVAR